MDYYLDVILLGSIGNAHWVAPSLLFGGRCSSNSPSIIASMQPFLVDFVGYEGIST